MEAKSIPRVQTLVLNGSPEVPRQYIQPPDTRPTVTATATASIPSVDLSTATSADISLLCRDWGAFHITNHGVPIKVLDDMRRVGRTFFEEVEMWEKLKYACGPELAAEGYGSRMLVEENDGILDWRDYFDHHTFPISRRDLNRWPRFPNDYREVVAEYSNQMKALAQRILGLISVSLGLPSSCIEEGVGEMYQNITVSYYPPCPQPDLTLGLQSHSDFGAITLLIQDDVAGLQVFKEGEWVNVPPLSDAIIVLLSDQTEIITNGKYRSAIHRAVTNANQARLSVATFHDPAKSAIISPASELIEVSPPKYRHVTYGDYVKSWYTKGPEGKRNIDALLI